MQITLLGTGTSMGVPQIGCRCECCCSTDPRDRRTRTAAIIQEGDTTVLIDTPPELRLQLTGAGITTIDAVLYTHLHADHVHGIDDLRSISNGRETPLPILGSEATLNHLRHRFAYIFDPDVVPLAGTSKPRLTARAIKAGIPFTIGSLPVLPLAFRHGHEQVFGYRFGPIAYITDIEAVPTEVDAALRDLDVLVLSALWWRPHPTHLSIPQAIDVARRVGARRTILTHLTHETSHAELLERLPDGVEPGWDGMNVRSEK